MHVSLAPAPRERYCVYGRRRYDQRKIILIGLSRVGMELRFCESPQRRGGGGALQRMCVKQRSHTLITKGT